MILGLNQEGEIDETMKNLTDHGTHQEVTSLQTVHRSIFP